MITLLDKFRENKWHRDERYDTLIKARDNGAHHIIVTCRSKYIEDSESYIGSWRTKRIGKIFPVYIDRCDSARDKSDIIM